MAINSNIHAILSALSRNIPLYHGTSSTEAYNKIKASGLVPRFPAGSKGSNAKLAPMVNSVYLTKYIGYALIYALGGDVAGSSIKSVVEDPDRYGYVFVVNSDNVGDSIKPDEDTVGEMYYAKVNKKDFTFRDGTILPNKEIPNVIVRLANEYATPNMIAKAKAYDDYGDIARIGKKIIKYMSPKDKLELAELSDNISVESVVFPDSCYRVDKRDAEKYNKDGSNFFELATKLY